MGNHSWNTDLGHAQLPSVVFTNGGENVAAVLLDETGKESGADVDIE